MISHYGYRDGSGEYFVAVSSDSCTGCGECVTACPAGALAVAEVLVGLDEVNVAAVRDGSRNALREACAGCAGAGRFACKAACAPGAIEVTWKRA